MPVRHLLPFALPTGRTGRIGRLTVYLSPRLKEKGRLRDYPEFLDWPATLTSRLGLQVRIDGAVVSHRVVSAPPSSDVWTAVFGPRAPVNAHRFVDFSATVIQPMATSDFSTAVLDLYVRAAREHPDGPPGGGELLALARAAGLLDGSGSDPEPGSLAEAEAYRAPMDDPDTGEPEAPGFDVHASISLLGHHPELLRQLGLAIDLEVDLSAAPTRVSVTTGYGGPGGLALEAGLVTMTTANFLAQPNPDPTLTEQDDGFLTLAAEKAFLSIVDPHLAASRLTQATRQARRHDEGSLPALATRALTLVRPDLTSAYANRTKRQAELEKKLRANLTAAGPPVQLFAEDLSIGQRLDVLDLTDGTDWLSLFQRESVDGYSFPRAPELGIVPKPDEGWNTTILTTEQDDVRPEPNPDTDEPVQPSAVFRLDDAVYRWNGWSGAAPPPGRVLDSATGEPAAVDPNLPGSDQTAQVAVDYRVLPSSLPRLRFGKTYQMRARCVDLAGNSRDLSTVNDPVAAAPPEPFGRLEPITAPVVVRRSPRPEPGVGDLPDQLVLRSDYDIEDASVPSTDRLIFPGRVGQDLCELHGQPAGGADPASYADLAKRDARDLSDQTVTDPRTGEVVAGTARRPGGPIEPGPTRQDIQYLSDPATDGIRFVLPALGPEVAVPLPGTWPIRQAARLVVSAGEGPVVVDPDPETDLAVFVPKAEIVSVQTSFSIDPDFLDHFGLWQRLGSDAQADLGDLVTRGGHWLFTPARALTLVHAVRRPLLAPAVDALSVTRELASNLVTLNGVLAASRRSTDRVDLTGSWTDTIDDPNRSGPEPRSTRISLGNVRVTRDESDTVRVERLGTPLPDTKRHLARIELEAYSSFASFFTDEQTVEFLDEPVLLDPAGVVAGSVEIRLADGSRARIGDDVSVDGPSGTIERVEGGAVPSGTTATVRYVARPISRTSDEQGGPEPFEVLFSNTVAPPPPVVDEIVPASARGADGRHSGQVLRIYLTRPWLVSGDGEQLAVVIGSGAGAETTAVGRDPLLSSPELSTALTVDDFPRATSSLTETDGTRLAVHPVTFDTASQRWYADVELADRFGYRPFLRLALARYQPDSLRRATRSATVRVEPVRLGLVRQTSATSPTSDLVDVTVGGTDGLGNRVQVLVQQADPAIADSDLRWSSVGDPVILTAAPPDAQTGRPTSWSGSVDVSAAVGAARLVIEELEPGRRDENGSIVEVWTTVFVEVVALPLP